MRNLKQSWLAWGSGREPAMAAGEMVVAVLAVTSGGGWAAAGEGRGRLLVVVQRQVLQSCTDPVLRRRGGASATRFDRVCLSSS